MPWCYYCRKELPAENFYPHRGQAKRKHNTRCKPCDSLYHRDKRRELVKRLVVACGDKCARCGGTFDQAVYDFHHRDPVTKEASICQLVIRRYSFEQLLVEAQKCDLLCANCHRLVHVELGGNGYFGRRSKPKQGAEPVG